MSSASPATLTEPVAPTLTRRQINLVFGTIMLGMLLAALDQTIVSTALPTIVGDLGGGSHVSWVVTSYLLTDTIATVLAGKFGDLFGRKLIFQLSAGLFVGASLMCALAGNMTWLVAWRAVQGIGAGGLMVTATALIADVVPLRERGKYQGALGAVFGVTTVIGPLLGGLFTDHLSWHWCFLVNLPIGILVIAVAARTMPSVRPNSGRPSIDYAGIAAISVVAGGLTLATSLGGTQYDWTSGFIIGLFVVAILGIPAFVLAERRAAQPMLPLHLFKNAVFSLSSVISLVVGFAMLGAMTFLPTYLQYVHGVSATSSGLRTLPMVVGLFAASITAGTIVGRTGRYKVFPIAGSLLMTVGLLLMSTMDAKTGFVRISAFMFVLGVGIGLCMQILTIIVQNTSDYRDLGVATSGVTFFRALGSSFGAAVFGAVYSGKLEHLLGPAIASSGLRPEQVSSPVVLHSQPAEVIAPVVNAYADVLQSVFLYAAPVGVLAFVLSLFLPEVPLRDAARAGATGVGEGFGMAESADSDRALEIQLARLMQREGRRALPEIRIASGTALGGAETWCVAQVLMRERRGVPADLDSIAQRTTVPASVLLPAFRQTQEAGYVTGDASGWHTTDVARDEWAVFSAALISWLLERLRTTPDTVPADSVMLEDALRRLADQVLSEEASSAVRPPDHALTG
jgi:EmrB/QacA subfamily drug resistance transporter